MRVKKFLLIPDTLPTDINIINETSKTRKNETKNKQNLLPSCKGKEEKEASGSYVAIDKWRRRTGQNECEESLDRQRRGAIQRAHATLGWIELTENRRNERQHIVEKKRTNIDKTGS